MTSSLNMHPEPVTRLQSFVAHRLFKQLIAVMIVANAIILGALTFVEPGSFEYRCLAFVDHCILIFFAFEIALKIFAWRRDFFRFGWNIFDLIVVGISLVPASETFAVLRAMRVLRILRLLHIVPMMRRISEALFRALPGMGAISAVMALMVYVGAVMATNLFGQTENEEVARMFGSLPASALSMFQVMTMDGWRFEVMQKVIDDGHPYAWLFFLIYLFLASFAILNLFIAVFVEALRSEHDAEQDDRIEELDDKADEAKAVREEMLALLKAMRLEIAELREQNTSQAKSKPE